MKRIANYLIALAVMAFTFTSCEDVPSPFGDIVKPASGDDVVVIEASGTGTETDPYNVTAVLEYISGLGADTPSDKDVYVKGYAVELTDISAQYGNATFTMSDNAEGTANKFTVYRAKGLGNEAVTDPNFIKQGDLVVVCGKVTNYKGNTPETVQGQAYVYSVNGVGGGATPSETLGTKDAPITVAKALEYIKALDDNGTTKEDAYVTGKITQIKTSDANIAQYKNIDYVISDGTNELTVFRGKNLDNTDFTAAGQINVGDEVVVFGKLTKYVKDGNTTPEVAQGNYIVKLTKGSGGGGDTNNLGTEAAPLTVAKALEIINALADNGETDDAYVKGIISKVSSYNSKYKSITYYISDDGKEANELQVYSGKGLNGADFAAEEDLSVGDQVVVKGKLKKYVNNSGAVTLEINQSSEIVKITKAGDSNTGDNSALLTNGNFETWADGLPTGWKSASTASSATLTQSTDAHGGSYSCNVNGNESSNKRLASQEIKLAAGTYVFSFWVKPTTTDAAQVRPGYVPITDGSAGSYAYGDYATLSAGWQQVSYEFTLNAETTVCLVVMNPKKSSYSSGKDVLIDDATLTKK